LPDACVSRLAEADLILHAGDFTAASVLEELERYGPVEAVHGNMDEPVLRERLPAQRVVDVDGVRIGMTHDGGPAARRVERLTARFPDCDAIVYGHSHVSDATEQGGTWILNPGSPTERRRAPEHTMILLRMAAGRLEPEVVTL
jgi:putative phosphoesterase